MFYAVDPTNTAAPPTVFCERFWDERENWYNAGVGIVTGTTRPYFGPIPNRPQGPIVGNDAQWAEGLSYETWIAGGYHDPVGCWPVYPNLVKGKLSQKQSIERRGPETPNQSIDQAQSMRASGMLFYVQQSQFIASLGRSDTLDQAQELKS